MADQKTFDLTQRATFAAFTPVTMRLSDTDMLGHINNVATAAYFEAARCEIFYKLMSDGGLTKRGEKARIDFVLARVAIDFKKEFFYPGTVEVGSRFIRLGNRSVVGAMLESNLVAGNQAMHPKLRDLVAEGIAAVKARPAG